MTYLAERAAARNTSFSVFASPQPDFRGISRAARTLIARFGLPPSTVETVARVELTRDQALRAFARPEFAISDEESRYYLNGILLHDSSGGLIRSVATDGHRLASVISTASQYQLSGGDRDQGGDRGIIVPRQAVALALKLLRGRKPESVILRRSKTLVEISTDGFSLTSRLIDATYPDFERLIPGPQPNQATIDRVELIEALERLGAVAERESKTLLGAVGLELAEGDTAISLTLSRQPDVGSDLIDAELTGRARIAFNVDLLTEQLGELEGERVRFDIDGNGTAMIIDPGDEGLVTLLMQCRR
jgi:DNA polymerase-3 subunit beta